MVIVGAGYIACEQACIFNNFGTEVHMLYMEEVALGGELIPQIKLILSNNHDDDDDDVYALLLMIIKIIKQPQGIRSLFLFLHDIRKTHHVPDFAMQHVEPVVHVA